MSAKKWRGDTAELDKFIARLKADIEPEGEVKLLPLPAYIYGHECAANERVLSLRMAEDYARANMEPLLAENERLREEVSELRVKNAMLERSVEASHETINIGHRLHEALANEMREAGVVVESDPLRVVNRRAERLAEALRELVADWDERSNTVLRQARDADESEVAQYHITAGALSGCANELRAALDQEGGNG